MSITSADELIGMQRVGRVVALALAAMREAVQPGATPADVEAVGAEVLRQQGAQAAPVVVYQAPCAAFVSVNECVVHGLPTRTPLRAGDLVKIDVTPMMDGFVADGAITVPVEPSTSRRPWPKSDRAFPFTPWVRSSSGTSVPTALRSSVS